MPGMSYIGGSYYGDEATLGDIQTHKLKPPTSAQMVEHEISGVMTNHTSSGVVREYTSKGVVTESKTSAVPAQRQSTAIPVVAPKSGTVKEPETTGGYYG